MAHLTRVLCAGIVLVTAALPASSEPSQPPKPRLLVLTDVGGDPDDQQSLIRLMLYACDFDIEGLIASASGTPGELKKEVVQPELIRAIIGAYAKARPNLLLHRIDYPTPDDLLGAVKSGNPSRGRASIGEGHDTEASIWIISRADREDPRPLNISIWGGQTDFAQALWRVRQDRGPKGLTAFIHRVRVYDIDDQDALQLWIHENFPDVFYVLAKAPPKADKRQGGYRGMYLGGDESLTSSEWVDSHVRTHHGPLGALYPTKTWTAPNPHSTLTEGDTPSVALLPADRIGRPRPPRVGLLGRPIQTGAEGRALRRRQRQGRRRPGRRAFDGLALAAGFSE